MKRRSSCIVATLLSAAAALGVFTPTASAQTFVPVTQQMLENPDPADWLMLNRTFDEQRFSPLDQINKNNVGQLRMAWARGLPNGTQELTPTRLSRRHVSLRARRQHPWRSMRPTVI